MKKKIKAEIEVEQYGSMADKGTRNAIYVMIILSERATAMQQKLYLCFFN